jgi:hypothetical protein
VLDRSDGLIICSSNACGGAHKGKPRKKDNAEFIHDTANSVIIFGHPHPVGKLIDIVEIVVDALTPLRLALRK